ncbi:MAG: hypothetical protein ACF8LL_11360, partial [Phycisphaerales bacterium]
MHPIQQHIRRIRIFALHCLAVVIVVLCLLWIVQPSEIARRSLIGVAGATGLVLAVWGLCWDRPRGRRRCPKCWYDLGGTPPDDAGRRTCPECGRVVRRERDLLRTRRRWLPGMAGVVLLVGAVSVAAWPVVREYEYRDKMPLGILVFMVEQDVGPDSLTNEL